LQVLMTDLWRGIINAEKGPDGPNALVIRAGFIFSGAVENTCIPGQCGAVG
jgi:hypothetical protein